MAKKIEANGDLDWLAESLSETILKPGEYTARMAYEDMQKRGIPVTLDTIRNGLIRKANRGEILMRKAVLDGTITSVYCKKP